MSAKAAADAARYREEEAALTPQERATRELVRAFEGSDTSRLSAAIDAGQAAGLDNAALLPALDASLYLWARAQAGPPAAVGDVRSSRGSVMEGGREGRGLWCRKECSRHLE